MYFKELYNFRYNSGLAHLGEKVAYRIFQVEN